MGSPERGEVEPQRFRKGAMQALIPLTTRVMMDFDKRFVEEAPLSSKILSELLAKASLAFLADAGIDAASILLAISGHADAGIATKVIYNVGTNAILARTSKRSPKIFS